MSSPFGVRRRLKALFGIESAPAAAAPERAKVQLTLVGPDGSEQTTEAFAGTSLVSASTRLKRPIATGCSESTCATCRVEVLEGAENLAPQSDREVNTLAENKHPTTLRLGCRAEVLGGAVKVKAFELL
jgi:ferredoxin